MFSFLAGALVWDDFPKLNLYYSADRDNLDFLALSGWDCKGMPAADIQLCSDSWQSTLVVNLAQATKSKFAFSFTPAQAPPQTGSYIRIYVNDRLKGTIEPGPEYKWSDYALVLEKENLSPGVNTITFARDKGLGYFCLFKDLRIYNYYSLPFLPAVYLILEKPYWLLTPQGEKMRWSEFLSRMGIFLPSAMFFLFLMQISCKGDSRQSRRIVFLSLASSSSLFGLIYLLPRLLGLQIIFSSRGLGVFLLASVIIFSLGFYSRIFDRSMWQRSNGIMRGSVAGSRVVAIAFRYFLVLSILSALLQIAGKVNISEEIMNWACLFLGIGILLRVFKALGNHDL